MSTGGINVDEVRLAPTGAVYVAAIGSTAPTAVSDTLSAAWNNIGYTTEDGVSVTPNVDFGEILAWQSASPLIRPLQKVNMEVAFTIMQTNKAVTSLFFMGGTWTNGPAGVASLSIPSNPTYSNLEAALVIDYTDNKGYLNRLYMPRGIVTKRDAVKIQRKGVTEYGITYMVNDSNGVLGTLFSNNTSLYSS